MKKFEEFNFSIEDTIADFEFVSVDVNLFSENGDPIYNDWDNLNYNGGLDLALNTVYEFERVDGKGRLTVVARNRPQQEFFLAVQDVLNAEKEKDVMQKLSYLFSNFYSYMLFSFFFMEGTDGDKIRKRIDELDDTLIEKDFFNNTVKEILHTPEDFDPTKLPTYEIPFVDKKKSEQVFDILDEVEAELEKEAH